MNFFQLLIYRILMVVIVLFSPLNAQNAPPGSDIYLFPLSMASKEITLGTPKNLTDRHGYDNQPAFTSDGKAFLFTSYRNKGQADVFYFNLKTSESNSVTATPESEYSPTPIRGDSLFSAVRVEMDGTQRLWQFNMDGSNPKVILDSIINVGYHGWGNDSTLGLFIVGSPNTFNLVNTVTGTSEIISENSGRSIHKVPGENALSFVQKISDDAWWIKKIDLKSRLISPIILTLPGSEDYAWTSNGILLMAGSASLYKFDPISDEEWKLVTTFSHPGLQTIKRIAVSPDDGYLLLVSDRDGY